MREEDYRVFEKHREKKHDCINGWMYDLLDELEERRIREIVKDEITKGKRRIN